MNRFLLRITCVVFFTLVLLISGSYTHKFVRASQPPVFSDSPYSNLGCASIAPPTCTDCSNPACDCQTVVEPGVLATPTPLPTPVLTATLLGPNSNAIHLSWIENSTDHIGFIVERSIAGAPFVLLTPVPLPPTTTSLDQLNLNNAVQYCYRVKALGTRVIFMLDKSKTPLPADFRVGISYGVSPTVFDTNGKVVKHDRTISLEAVVTPPSLRDELLLPNHLASSPKLKITNIKKKGNDSVTFDLEGVRIGAAGSEGSDIPGDESILALFSDGIVVKQTFTVVVPWKLGTHSPATSATPKVFKVSPFNLATNITTLLPAFTVMPPDYECYTFYAQPFDIMVLDKWNMPIDALYDDSLIIEIQNPGTTQEKDVDLNVRLGVSDVNKRLGISSQPSTYKDNVGGPVFVKVVIGNGPAKRFNDSTDYQPLPGDVDVTQEYGIKIDGFRLHPDKAISNRHLVINATKDTNGNPIVMIPTDIIIDWP